MPNRDRNVLDAGRPVENVPFMIDANMALFLNLQVGNQFVLLGKTDWSGTASEDSVQYKAIEIFGSRWRYAPADRTY